MVNQNTSTQARPALNGQISFTLEAKAYDGICQGMEALATLKDLIEQFGTGPVEVPGNGLASLVGCIADRLESSIKAASRSRLGE